MTKHDNLSLGNLHPKRSETLTFRNFLNFEIERLVTGK